MTQEHIPVLIVGAGGAGLSLSLLLRQQGILSMLVERRSDVSWYPRARNLNFRAAGTRVSRVFRKQSLASSEQEELLDPSMLFEHLEAISPDQFIWYCPQSRLEPLLLAEARRRGGDVRYNTELVSFMQDDTGVTATLQDRATGRSQVMHSDYLIAADGAHSKIRETLGVPTKGLGELDEHYIFVYFRADWSQLIRGYESDGILIENTNVRSMFLITDKDRGMFLIMYSPSQGESAQNFTAERCKNMILSAMGKADMAIEIVDMAHWQPAERVAERFQQGHVFLVGDAAHTMPPKMGLGVNTAIQSAQNLAWKLAAVLKGYAAPQLLATYQTERHPVGWFAAEQSLTGPAAALFEQDGGGGTLHPLEKQLPFLHPIIGYRYRSEAILSEDAATPSPDGIELLDRPELNGLPGTRAPHLWVERQGQRISTLDLLDGRFVLLTGTGGTAWCEAAAMIAADMGIGLATYRIGADADLLDLENGWQTKMGMSAEGAVLVRPDGFVAWRTSTFTTSPEPLLERVLSHILCWSTPPT